MKDRKLQVFVSSTYTDLIEERQAAVEAILSAGHIPAGMELFSAGDEAQMTVIKRWIDESDVYLLILGGRYGSIDKESGKSYTQLEYEYAVETRKAFFAVVMSDSALDARHKSLGSAAIERNIRELENFRASVLSKLVKFWDDKKDIQMTILKTLSEFSERDELIGWVKGDRTVNSLLLSEEITKLTNENADLKNQIANTRSNTLYSGLTYDQLEKLLNREKHDLFGDLYTSFEFFVENGRQFVNGYSPHIELYTFFQELQLYRLIKYSPKGSAYFFTEEGHNFYIITLSKYPKLEDFITSQNKTLPAQAR